MRLNTPSGRPLILSVISSSVSGFRRSLPSTPVQFHLHSVNISFHFLQHTVQQQQSKAFPNTDFFIFCEKNYLLVKVSDKTELLLPSVVSKCIKCLSASLIDLRRFFFEVHFSIAMEIKGNPNPAELIGAAESVGSNTGHCKRRLSTESSNSDTEASGSCNFEPVKRPRKVLKKMAGPSHELGWEEMNTQEVPETQYLAVLNVDLSPSDTKALLEEAAKVVNDCPMSNKCYANISFSITECDIIAKKLHCKHSIYMRDHQVKRKLESLFFAFEAYCKEMKLGSSGLSFYWEDGTVSTAKRLHEMCDPIVSKLHQIQQRWEDVISNFGGLRRIYPFVWDRYFKNGSKKRSGSNMQSSSSKRSRGSSSSVKNFKSDYEQVLNRLGLFFGKGPDKRLSLRYAEAAKTLYGYHHVECLTFLALEDDEAKEYFLTKMGGV